MKQIVLGQEGLAFFQSFLKAGNVLAQEALTMVGYGGSAITWLPNGAELSQVSFHEGLGMGEEPPQENIWQPTEEIARLFLDGASRRAIILEAASVRLDEVDELVRICSVSYDFSYMLCDAGETGRADQDGQLQYGPSVSVLGYLTGAGKTIGQISDFLEQAFAYHQLAVFTSIPEDDNLVSGMKVEREHVRKLVAQTEYIAAGAYDGSGVVLWDCHSILRHRIAE